MFGEAHTTAISARAFERPAAAILTIAPILSVVFMVMHPTTEARDAAEAFAEMSREAATNRIVHGVLVTLAAFQVFGFIGFAKFLNLQRPLVLGGILAYAMGFVGIALGAVINGLVATMFEARFTGAPLEKLELARVVLGYSWSINQSFIQAGVVASSFGILCWSLTLVRARGAWRWLGAIGLLAGAWPIVGIVSGHLPMDIHGFGAVVLVQSAWTISIGIRLGMAALKT